jgi:hypothetical protein
MRAWPNVKLIGLKSSQRERLAMKLISVGGHWAMLGEPAKVLFACA